MEQGVDAERLRADLRRAQEALGAEEDRFDALFSSIDEGCCICEVLVDDDGAPVDYRFLEVNHLFESMTGLHDVVGRRAYELLPDLEPHWLERYAAVALDRRPCRFEGASAVMGRWFDVFAMPIQPERHFLLLFRDISKRKRAEEVLRGREREGHERRWRAELLAAVLSELGAEHGVRERAERLARLLVPALADVIAVELPDVAEPIVVPPDGRHVALAELGRGEGAGEAGGTVVVPLELGTGKRGRLLVAVTDPAREGFAADELGFIRDLARHAALLIASARVTEQEHQVAVRLQHALLPDELVEHPGVSIAARYQAAGAGLEVGGDWYETFTLPDGCLGLAVGDVVGHGLEAAAVMGRMRAGLVALAARAEGPGVLMDDLDRFASGVGGPAFATACCAFLDAATGVLTYSSAGHPAVLVVTSSGEVTWLDDAPSWPLCVGVDEARPEASIVLEPGALVLLYSDGLVERRSEALTVGAARLAEVTREVRHEPVGAVCDRLLRDMNAGPAFEDDVVVLAMRYEPEGRAAPA